MLWGAHGDAISDAHGGRGFEGATASNCAVRAYVEESARVEGAGDDIDAGTDASGWPGAEAVGAEDPYAGGDLTVVADADVAGAQVGPRAEVDVAAQVDAVAHKPDAVVESYAWFDRQLVGVHDHIPSRCAVCGQMRAGEWRSR
ncbi:hypothetical protein GCM10020295_37600 [Streptomyces cinereospinus]